MDPRAACRLTASEALQAFSSGSLTIEAYTQSLLARIEVRDASVNAWAHLDPPQVLATARALDAVPQAERGPLHGLPIAVKDVIYTKGQPTQHNSPIYAGDQPEVDAGSVIMLKQAGAFVLGKTRTTEFAAITKGAGTANPHNVERTPGGSSSGSGAVVADFQACLSLGTQTGGSVIRPASFSGVFGLKPTWNAITREGQKIYSLTLDTLGFYARSVQDLQLLSEVFGLADDTPPKPISQGLQGMKFAFIKTMVWETAGPGSSEAFQLGADLLREQGAEVSEIEFPAEFALLSKWHSCILYSEGRSAFRPDYARAKEQLDQSLIDQVEGAHGYSRRDYLTAFDGVATLRPKFDAIAQQFDAVVAPSTPDAAPMGLESTGNAVFNSLWTALHVPVVNVPGFEGEGGMPVGLSLIKERYADQALLEVATVVGRLWGSKGGWTSAL